MRRNFFQLGTATVLATDAGLTLANKNKISKRVTPREAQASLCYFGYPKFAILGLLVVDAGTRVIPTGYDTLWIPFIPSMSESLEIIFLLFRFILPRVYCVGCSLGLLVMGVFCRWMLVLDSPICEIYWYPKVVCCRGLLRQFEGSNDNIY